MMNLCVLLSASAVVASNNDKVTKPVVTETVAPEEKSTTVASEEKSTTVASEEKSTTVASEEKSTTVAPEVTAPAFKNPGEECVVDHKTEKCAPGSGCQEPTTDVKEGEKTKTKCVITQEAKNIGDVCIFSEEVATNCPKGSACKKEDGAAHAVCSKLSLGTNCTNAEECLSEHCEAPVVDEAAVVDEKDAEKNAPAADDKEATGEEKKEGDKETEKVEKEGEEEKEGDKENKDGENNGEQEDDEERRRLDEDDTEEQENEENKKDAAKKDKKQNTNDEENTNDKESNVDEENKKAKNNKENKPAQKVCSNNAVSYGITAAVFLAALVF